LPYWSVKVQGQLEESAMTVLPGGRRRRCARVCLCVTVGAQGRQATI
jgi:hypothetical protein